MGLFIKNNHGIEYVYSLIGKTHFYIGPKNTPEQTNTENVRKAVSLLDDQFNKFFDKYLNDLEEHLSYLPEPERKEYLSKRTTELLGRLRLPEEVIPKKTSGLNIHFTNATAAASPSRKEMDKEIKKRSKNDS